MLVVVVSVANSFLFFHTLEIHVSLKQAVVPATKGYIMIVTDDLADALKYVQFDDPVQPDPLPADQLPNPLPVDQLPNPLPVDQLPNPLPVD
eukprot:g19192.t1